MREQDRPSIRIYVDTHRGRIDKIYLNRDSIFTLFLTLAEK